MEEDAKEIVQTEGKGKKTPDISVQTEKNTLQTGNVDRSASTDIRSYDLEKNASRENVDSSASTDIGSYDLEKYSSRGNVDSSTATDIGSNDLEKNSSTENKDSSASTDFVSNTLGKSYSRGLALLIFNTDFTKAKMKMLKEGNQIERLRYMFKQIKFKVCVYENIDANEIKKMVKKHAEEEWGCFMCLIASHGRLGCIYGVDGAIVMIDDLIKLTKINSTMHKPVCFFFDACREEPFEDYKPQYERPDTLISYSCLAHRTSTEFGENGGGLFFETFIEVFKKGLKKRPYVKIGGTCLKVRSVQHFMQKIKLRIRLHGHEKRPPSVDDEIQQPSVYDTLDQHLVIHHN